MEGNKTFKFQTEWNAAIPKCTGDRCLFCAVIPKWKIGEETHQAILTLPLKENICSPKVLDHQATREDFSMA